MNEPLQFPRRPTPPGDPQPQGRPILQPNAPAFIEDVSKKLPQGEVVLSMEQQRAVATILTETFICIGIRPTPGGADTVSSVSGDPAELRAILPHLPAIIEQALTRRGI